MTDQPFVPAAVPSETDDQAALMKIVAGLVPATAQQVGVALGKLSQRLQVLTDLLAKADEDATQLTERYELALDTTFLEQVDADSRIGMHPVHKATARVQTAGLRMDMEVAKLSVRQLREAHKTLDRRIDVGRTQAATVRSEHRTIGYAS